MPLKIVRNDITKMNTEAIVNTANMYPIVGVGCDGAVYKAAGYEELLEYRKTNIGIKQEGESFITPGFNLDCKYIIHTVSPLFSDGKHDEEKKLRNCYKNSLKLAKENNISSVSFPLIATGSFMFPKEEGLRIAIDEISAFLFKEDMLVYIVVYDKKSNELAKRIAPDLKSYIKDNYVPKESTSLNIRYDYLEREYLERYKEKPYKDDLESRLYDASDTFTTKLLDLINEKGLKNKDVYTNAFIDRKLFSKIKNDADYHPTKYVALMLCIGAHLTIDEAKDLLNSAGYSLSKSNYTDIIFEFFIEKKNYSMEQIAYFLSDQGIDLKTFGSSFEERFG